MKKAKPVYKIKREGKRWLCINMQTQEQIGSYAFRKNAVAAAALANSVHRKYGGIS